MMVVSMLIPAHSISALCYRVHFGLVDLAPLVIRQRCDFDWGHSRVTAYVLGASHALTVALPDGREFTELLTCLPPRFALSQSETDSGSEWPVPLFNHAPVVQNIGGLDGISGQVRLTRFSLVPGADRINADFPPENALHEAFSLSAGETAWTRIAWRTDGPHLRVETIHTYPDDGAGVRSTTCLRLPQTL